MKRPLELAKTQNIVWLQTGFLGDIILNTAPMAWLHSNYSHISQHLITTKVGKLALVNQGIIQSVHEIDKSHIFSESKKIRTKLTELGCRLENTVLLQPHLSTRSSFIRLLLGYKSIIFEEAGFAFFAVAAVSRIAVFHEALRAGLLLQPLGIERKKLTSLKPKLDALKLDNTKPWMSFFADQKKRLIGIAPGSVWGTKRWPLAHFSGLIKTILLDMEDASIVILGAENEADLCNELESHFEQQKRLINLAGKTSLQDLLGIYPLLDCLFANDSSPVHYASAFDVPTIAIFGATVPEMGFGPLALHSKVEQTKGLPCRPCGLHGPQICPLSHFQCMKNISVNQVYESFKKIMGGSNIKKEQN